MDSVIPFIVWIFCIGLAALIIGKALDDHSPSESLTTIENKEAFVDMRNILRLTTCPPGTNAYVLGNGDTNCCSGEVVGNQCNGEDICILSPDPYNKEIGSCSAWLAKEWASRASRFCPPSMPNYFGQIQRGAGIHEGCSASVPIPDGSQPSTPTDKRCKIYSSYNDEVSKSDSCTNLKGLENMRCPVSSATKTIVAVTSPGKMVPVLLKCNYLPPNGKSSGLPVDCIEEESFKRYTTVAGGSLSDDYMSKSVRFCKASKAYYVDSSLTTPTALDVPGLVAPPAKTPKPYDNGKVYVVGDLVIFKGKTYKMVEGAGAAGYNPERPGDKLWSLQR